MLLAREILEKVLEIRTRDFEAVDKKLDPMQLAGTLSALADVIDHLVRMDVCHILPPPLIPQFPNSPIPQFSNDPIFQFPNSPVPK